MKDPRQRLRDVGDGWLLLDRDDRAITIAGAGGILGFGRSYAVTPDGQRFVAIVSVADTTPHPATVILNWRATLGEPRSSR